MVSRKVALAIAAAGSAGVIAYAGLSQGMFDRALDHSRGAIASCEARLMADLRSPSTYRRVRAEYQVETHLNEEQFGAYLETKGCVGAGETDAACMLANNAAIAYGARLARQRAQAAGRRLSFEEARRQSVSDTFARHSQLPPEERQGAVVSIDYDAANAYGAPIRGRHVCHFGRARQGAYREEDIYRPADMDTP